MRKRYYPQAFVLMLILFSIPKVSYAQQAVHNNSIKVKIYFAAAPLSCTVSKSPLKYNKEFAYSFTFDDGKEDAYTNAFTLFSGGMINGTNYPGLFYTDGCGNKISFKGGLAINSINSAGMDPHVSTEGSIKWNQVTTLYNAGWNIFNHSYSHMAGPGTNYNYQVSENTSYIKAKTGIHTNHFVIPSGDINYLGPAFENGMKAVYNQKDFPGVEGLKVDSPIDLRLFKFYRQFLSDDNYNISTITRKIDLIAGNSNSANHLWYSEFTHHVSHSPEGGSLRFGTFEHYMKYIESKYGASGNDRIWMAPLQDVYEYLWVRENTAVSSSLQQEVVEVNLDFSLVSQDLDKYSITLLVDSDKDFVKVEADKASVLTYNGSGARKIINVEWHQHPQMVTATYDPLLINVGRCQMNTAQINPNPVTAPTIMLKLKESSEDQVSIFLVDESGKEVFLEEQNISQNQERMTVSIEQLNLSSGTYFLKLVSEKENCGVTKMMVKY